MHVTKQRAAGAVGAAALTTAAFALLVRPLVRAARGVPGSMGARIPGIRRTAARSAHYDGQAFHNRLPATVLQPSSTPGLLRAFAARGDSGKPTAAVPLTAPSWPDPPAALAVTWFGHASALLEVDGHRVLVDPVWGERVSPSPTVGPQPAAPGAGRRWPTLPPVDAVVISHDHYDHLDLPTVARWSGPDARRSSSRSASARTCAAGACPTTAIVELDWDERSHVGELTLTCTEARHFSGRGFARNTTLWSSWVVTGPQHRVFFGGDTGYTPAFAGIGAQLRPVRPDPAADRRLQRRAGRDIHMNPEEAVQAHGDLGGRCSSADPLGDVQPGFHRWAEPVERLLAAAEARVRIAVPRPGGRVEPGPRRRPSTGGPPRPELRVEPPEPKWSAHRWQAIPG